MAHNLPRNRLSPKNIDSYGTASHILNLVTSFVFFIDRVSLPELFLDWLVYEAQD
jgi:hypothetical protein